MQWKPLYFIGVMLGIYRDDSKETGNYYTVHAIGKLAFAFGFVDVTQTSNRNWMTTRVVPKHSYYGGIEWGTITGLYRDNGKENGNYSTKL